MLNYIWFGMMAISVVAGIFTGRIDAVTEAAINMSKVAVEISIGLIGIMALWLGLPDVCQRTICSSASSSISSPRRGVTSATSEPLIMLCF